MTTQATTPPGATLHLGGDAYAHPSLQDRLVPIDTVTPYPGNPRRGDQPAITASIRDLGLYTGVVAQKSTGHILVGNHRRHGLIDLGATSIPVDYLDVDDTRAAAIVARDNRTSDQGGYDDAELLALLTADDDVLALSGYDDDDLARILSLVELPREGGPPVDVNKHLRDAGVGDFQNDDLTPALQVTVSFRSEEDYTEFRRRLDFTGPRRVVKGQWFPQQLDLIEAEREYVAAEETG